MVRRFLKSENGATLVEYGVALVLAISAGGAALVALGNQTSVNMNAACETLQYGGQVANNCVVGGEDE